MFDGELDLSAQTKVYGEGYSMLAQYAGPLQQIRCITNLPDREHYRLAQKEGFQTVYHMALLEQRKDCFALLGFASCHQFVGEIRFCGCHVQIALSLENLVLQPGETLNLEEFCVLEGVCFSDLLQNFAAALNRNHPPLAAKRPTGWCSWEQYGPGVTLQDVQDNLDAIIQHDFELEYIQIDDGYQRYMGDWLSFQPSFEAGFSALLQAIREAGCQPAIWVAPFIAEKDSELFRHHPDWFVKDEAGNPLPSDQVTFGGWRRGSWYMLDGTNPDACRYLTEVFRTFREQYGITYFKMDAMMWGCIPAGVRYDPSKTCVQAYRTGMKAILEGAGEDGYLLGCNAPMWPSLGTVHGMRTSGDVTRKYPTVYRLSYENLWRSWQHNRLWINDPDMLLLAEQGKAQVGPDGTCKENTRVLRKGEVKLHVTYLLATGGAVLSGDGLDSLNEEQYALLKRILDLHNDQSAVFSGTDFTVGRTEIKDKTLLFLMNREEEEKSITVDAPGCGSAVSIFTNDVIPVQKERLTVKLPPHSGETLLLKKEQ